MIFTKTALSTALILSSCLFTTHSIAGDLHGSLTSGNQIRLHFSTEKPINAAWVGSKVNGGGMTFSPIQYDYVEEIDGEYFYQWDSHFTYNESQTYEFFIQANSLEALHYAPGKNNSEYYMFEPLNTPVWQQAEYVAGGVQLKWQQVKNATHYKIDISAVGRLDEVKNIVAYVPSNEYFLDKYVANPLFNPLSDQQITVTAIDKNGRYSHASEVTGINGEPVSEVYRSPKLEVPYFGNGIMTVASNYTNIEAWAGPFTYLGKAYGVVEGRVRTHYRSDLCNEWDMPETEEVFMRVDDFYLIPQDLQNVESERKTVTPQYGAGINPRPNPELIPRPNGRLLIVADADENASLTASITLNGEQVAYEGSWEKVNINGQWVHRLNAGIGAKNGDDYCVTLNSNAGIFPGQTQCHAFIRELGSLFGSVEGSNLGTSDVFDGVNANELVVTGWYNNDFPRPHDQDFRLHGTLGLYNPQVEFVNRPDIVQRYGDEFASSIVGYELKVPYEEILKRHQINVNLGTDPAEFNLYYTAIVWDQIGNQVALANSLDIPVSIKKTE